jgi:undecaprenyl-diphosphatase
MISLFKKGIREFWQRVTLLSIELIVVIVAFFASFITFVSIARMVFIKKREDFDERVFRYLETHISSINTGVMQFFSFLGSHYFLIPANILIAAYFLFIKKQTWYSIKIPVISLSSLLLMFALKQFFHRDRPLEPLLHPAKGLSFPSGHALMSLAFYGLLLYITRESIENKTLKLVLITILVLMIFFIGLSRIYLRVHYASDVLAGFSLGLIWLVLSLAILNKIERINTKEPIILRNR